MESLEKSWNSIYFSRPEIVMEIDSRFGEIHKKSWELKGILLRNNVPFFHPAFQYKDTFMYSDQILVSSISSCTVTGTLCVVLEGKTGRSSWPWCKSLLCHESCKRFLSLKLCSWRSHGKNIEI